MSDRGSTPFWVSTPQPSGEVERAVARAIRGDGIQEAEQLILTLTDELASILRTHDPIPLIGQVAFLSLVVGSHDSYARYGSEAKVQYLLGVATSAPRRSMMAPGPDAIQRAIDLVAQVFDLEAALIRAAPTIGERHIDAARRALRNEALLDRFQGYSIHLRSIQEAVFEPLRRQCEEALGWCPADAYPIWRAIREIVRHRISLFHASAHDRLNRARGSTNSDRIMSEVFDQQAEFGSSLFVITPMDVGTASGIAEMAVHAALRTMSVEWGAQADYRRPTQDGRARRCGVVDVGEERYFVPVPHLLIQETFAWFGTELEHLGLVSLAKAYRNARDKATEELTRGALARVFGVDSVHGPLFYAMPEGQCEVDAIVTVPGDALIVECKAHTLTAAGRRGAPARLRKKFAELVEMPLLQSIRCAEYLADGGETFRDLNGRRVTIPTAPSAALPNLAVSFERIDPVAMQVAAAAPASSPRRVWLVSLADLLMLVDILADAGSFWAYAVRRHDVALHPRALVVAEPDILGLYLDDRCRGLLQFLKDEPDTTVAVGPGAQEINRYFGGIELETSTKRPRAQIPLLVLSALSDARAGESEWSDLAIAVLEQSDDIWRRYATIMRGIEKAAKQRRRALEAVDGIQPPLRVVCHTPRCPPLALQKLVAAADGRVLIVRAGGRQRARRRRGDSQAT